MCSVHVRSVMKVKVMLIYFHFRHGRVHLQNPNIKEADADVLYHFALDTKVHDFKEMFGDVKVWCL